MDVRLIAAVGRSGQIGLGDNLPWHDAEDLRWFRDQTQGGVVIAGGRTMASIPAAVRVADQRAWVVAPREAYLGNHAALRFLEAMHEGYGGRTLWIAGGSKTYAAFLPHVRRSFITHIDYDGHADAFLPPLWRAKP